MSQFNKKTKFIEEPGSSTQTNQIRNSTGLHNLGGNTQMGASLIEQLIEEFDYCEMPDRSDEIQQKLLQQLIESLDDKAKEVDATFKKTKQKEGEKPHFMDSTKSLQTTSKNNLVYIFYLIKEVLQFTPNNFPKNCCIQLIGKFKFDPVLKEVICDHEEIYGEHCKIKLDFSHTFRIPNFDEKIILFGTIYFEGNTPIVIVNFFQYSSVDYRDFIDIMLRVRAASPQENFQMVSVNPDSIDWNETMDEIEVENESANEKVDKTDEEGN